MSEAGSPPWWSPDRHGHRRAALLMRNRLKSAVRERLEGQGFTEVETSQLQVSPGNEAHLHAFRTEAVRPDGGTEQRYLATSPEFSCKKLLAAGETRIFEFARVFRNRERGALHLPEFTMLEWYRTCESHDVLMEDCAALLGLAAEVAERSTFTFRDRSMDPRAAPDRVTVAQAFTEYAKIDLLDTIGEGGEGDGSALAAQAVEQKIRIAADDTWSDVFSKILVARVEPRLGDGRATILCDYPACEAALARVKPEDARLAERFELYACGIELANAFSELTDAAEQRRRFEVEMAEKARIYCERYPIDEDFLAALEVMPPAAGAALGFDRLVMLAAGAETLDAVSWTPSL